MRRLFALSSPRFLTLIIRATLAGVPAIATALVPGAAHAQTAYTFDIPAGALSTTLTRIAAQSNLQLTVNAELTAGRQAPAIRGGMTARQALDAALSGSGLAVQQDGTGYTLVRVPKEAASDEATLPTVRTVASEIQETRPLAYLKTQSSSGVLGDRRILDTPFSIAVTTSEEIAERGARSIGQIFIDDAAVYTPTSSFTTDWWGTQIRGLPVRSSYIDDIPMLLYWGGDFPTEIVESVTALKGLAGFMYGFGEPGGVLSYQLKRPRQSDQTEVILGYRNPDLLSAHVDASHHLTDELAVRANVAAERGTTYNASDIERTVAAITVDKRFGSDVNWFTTLVHEEHRTEGEPLQFYFDDYDVATSGDHLPSVTYDYDDVNIDNSFYKTKTELVSTGVEWQFDERWRLKGQVGFSRKDHRSNKAFAYLLDSSGDYTGSMYNFAGRLDTFFSQLMLQGSLQTGGIRHELVGGLGQQRSKDAWSNEFYWNNDFDGNIHREQTFRVTRTPDFTLAPVDTDVRQTYFFLSDTVHFNDRWQAILGVRDTRYRSKDLDDDPDTRGYSAHNASPTLALIYKPDAQTSLYGSYVEGLEPGTRVIPPYANAGETLDATVSKQYEVGVKHAADTAGYTAALFRVERANQMDELRGADRYLSQDGLLIYQGVEVAGDYQFSEALNLGLSVVYLDATIDKVSADNIAIEGNRPSYAPEWQAVADVRYRVPALPGLELRGNLRYFGSSFSSDDNDLTIPGRTLANVGFSYDFMLYRQDLTLVGNIYNLFNRKYWAGGGWSAGNLGEARNLALSLQMRF